MGQRYAVAQRQEVLRLPRTRGADHYRVEAVSAEVLGAHDDVLELSAGFHPDRDHRPARVTPAAALSPQPFHIECARVADPQRPQQCFALPPIFGQVRGGRRRPAGQGAREAVGRALGEHVRNRERRTSMVQATLAHVEDLVFAGETDTRARPGRQAQHGDAGHPLLTGHTLPLVGGAGVVVDDDPVRAQWHRRGRLQGRRGVRRTRTVRRRPRPAPLPMQFGVQRILEVGRRGEHQTPQAARVEHLVVLVVRQPHQPRPTLGMARHDHELDVAGAVINRQRAQHRPHQGVQFGDVTDEAEPGSGPQTEHFADIGDGPLREHEVAEGATGDRFEFLTDRDLRPLQRRSRVRRGLHADAQAHVQEVRIGRPTLPHPRSADDGVELLWVAVDEGTVPAVLPRGPLYLVAILVEPPQVRPPLLFQLPPADPAAAAEPAAEHQGSETDQTDQREEAGLQRAHPGGVHHRQGAEDADEQSRHGDHHQDVARFPLRQVQGRFDGQAQRGGRGRRHPRTAAESSLRHRYLRAIRVRTVPGRPRPRSRPGTPAPGLD